MTNLERVIRPFQSPGYAPPATTPQSSLPASNPVHLEIGKSGEGTTFNGSSSSSRSLYMDSKAIETSRTTHVNRVKNPDDETQFVDVEVIDKLTTKGSDGSAVNKTNFVFHNNPTGPDAP